MKIRKITFLTLIIFLQYNFIVANDISNKQHSFIDSLLIKRSDSLNINSARFALTDSLRKDSINTKIKDTLKIYYQYGIAEKENSHFTLTKNEINLNDYRGLNDIFRLAPFSFVNNLGRIGQPSENRLFAFGYGSINFLSDGINQNSRIFNSYSSNLFQTESVDSISVAPLARGFLYGSQPNLSSINFSTIDRISRVPYSRIHFYQAPNSEAMLDIQFSAYLISRLNATLEISNRATDSYYTNTESGQWQSSLNLHYFLSDNFNLIGSYRYLYKNTGLFGGVNLDSIKNLYAPGDVEDVFYSSFRAPVYYGNESIYSANSSRYQKLTKYDYSLKLIGEYDTYNHMELVAYVSSALKEFRQNEKNSRDEFPMIKNNHSNDVYGIEYKQFANYKMIKLAAFLNYENTNVNSPLLINKESINSYTASGSLSLNLLSENLVPSIFGRFTNVEGVNYFGMGADLSFKISKNLSLYASANSFTKPYSVYEKQFIDNSTNQSFNSLNFKTAFEKKDFKVSLSYFLINNENGAIPYFDTNSKYKFINETSGYFLENKENSGLNLSLDIKWGKIRFTNQLNYYVHQQNDNYLEVPNFSSLGGVYFEDILFEKNLDLRAGINYYIYGQRDFLKYDFQTNNSLRYFLDDSGAISSFSFNKIPQDFQLDIFIAGKIQGAAYAYFVFENLLATNYYIVPYYPMGKGIRFGISWEFLN